MNAKEKKEIEKFIKRMEKNLKTYMPMLKGLNAGKGIKKDFEQAITFIKSLKSRVILSQAEAAGVTSVLLDLQQDCIAFRKATVYLMGKHPKNLIDSKKLKTILGKQNYGEINAQIKQK